jgi:prolipoprotein diacylglyceryltransferase
MGVLTYVVCQGIAIFLAFVVTLCLARAAGLPLARVLAALLVLLAAACVGAVVSAPSFPPRAGLRYPGTGLAVLAALPLVHRVLAGSPSLLALGDLMAAPLAFGMAVGKVGCFLHGCCHGWPSTVPWAVAFPGQSAVWSHQVDAGLISTAATESLPVHPLQLYFALWLIGVGMFVLAARRRPAKDGQLLLLTLALYAAALFVGDLCTVAPDLKVEVYAILMFILAAGGFLALSAMTRHPLRVPRSL